MGFIKKRAILVTFQFMLLLLFSGKIFAQDTMLDEFSYLYMEKLIAVAKENYPKNKTFDNRVNIANNNISIAKASWLDPFSFTYASRSNIYGAAGVNQPLLSGYFFNITLSPVSLLVKKPFDIKNAKEEFKSAKADQEEYAIQLEAEVKRRYIIYLQTQNTLKLVSKRLVDTEASFTYLKARYERSEISFTEFNDASTALTTTQESKINSEANYFNAKFALEELLTIKLEEIK